MEVDTRMIFLIENLKKQHSEILKPKHEIFIEDLVL